MFDPDDDIREGLAAFSPKARDTLRRVLIHDQADRDAISSRLMRYRTSAVKIGRHHRLPDDVSGSAASSRGRASNLVSSAASLLTQRVRTSVPDHNRAHCGEDRDREHEDALHLEPFVPSGFLFEYDRDGPDLSQLPSPARDLLVRYDPGSTDCSVITTDAARRIAQALARAGFAPLTNDPTYLDWKLPGESGGPSNPHLNPVLPHELNCDFSE